MLRLLDWMRAAKYGLGLGVVLGGLCVSSPSAAKSPLYGEAYRRGFNAEGAFGLNLCLGGGVGVGQCRSESLSAFQPGIAVHVLGGYRLSPYLVLGAAFDFRTLNSGQDQTGEEPFSEINRLGFFASARAILPLSRSDLGVELGLGWSQQSFGLRSQLPESFSSSGFAVRPAVVFDYWVLADLALGVEVAGMFNLHSWFCADRVCATDMSTIPDSMRGVFTHDLSMSLRMSVVFSLTP